jgi:hypothetical protein
MRFGPVIPRGLVVWDRQTAVLPFFLGLLDGGEEAPNKPRVQGGSSDAVAQHRVVVMGQHVKASPLL